jgi:AcrR family transcriptional regulator
MSVTQPVSKAAAPRSKDVVRDGGREGRALLKGQQTKAAIVDAALSLATQIGLEGLSIGALAEVTGMSKSGVFAHFGSREELQISVIREYHTRFEQEVFYPALRVQRGLPRLRAMFGNWMKRTSAEIDSGCIYISGAVEFDDRPGPVRDALAESVHIWLAAMNRAVVQAREEGPPARRCRREPGGFRDPRADSGAALRGPLPQEPRLDGACHHRFRQHPCALWRADERLQRAPLIFCFFIFKEPSHAQLYTPPARHAVRDARGLQGHG